MVVVSASTATSFPGKSNTTSHSGKQSMDDLIIENLDLKAQLVEKQKMVEAFKKEMDSIVEGLMKLEGERRKSEGDGGIKGGGES